MQFCHVPTFIVAESGIAALKKFVRRNEQRVQISKRNFRDGFTLLELIVVMVIMSIVLAVQLPRMGGRLTGSSLRSAAQAVTTLACAAKFRAADTGRPHVLIVDSRKNQMQLFMSPNGGPLMSKRFPEGVTVRRMKSQGREVDESLLRIFFYPRGTATQAELVLSGVTGDRSSAITVSPADGVVNAENR